MAALVLLDLSAGFRWNNSLYSRTDHVALSWMKSYLSDRSQHILIVNCNSTDTKLDSGVPHGSVLGPKL